MRCPVKGNATARSRDYIVDNKNSLDLSACYGYLEVKLRLFCKQTCALLCELLSPSALTMRIWLKSSLQRLPS